MLLYKAGGCAVAGVIYDWRQMQVVQVLMISVWCAWV